MYLLSREWYQSRAVNVGRNPGVYWLVRLSLLDGLHIGSHLMEAELRVRIIEAKHLWRKELCLERALLVFHCKLINYIKLSYQNYTAPLRSYSFNTGWLCLWFWAFNSNMSSSC